MNLSLEALRARGGEAGGAVGHEVPRVVGVVRDGGHQFAMLRVLVELQVFHDETLEGDLERVAVRLPLLEGGAELLALQPHEGVVVRGLKVVVKSCSENLTTGSHYRELSSHEVTTR